MLFLVPYLGGCRSLSVVSFIESKRRASDPVRPENSDTNVLDQESHMHVEGEPVLRCRRRLSLAEPPDLLSPGSAEITHATQNRQRMPHFFLDRMNRCQVLTPGRVSRFRVQSRLERQGETCHYFSQSHTIHGERPDSIPESQTGLTMGDFANGNVPSSLSRREMVCAIPPSLFSRED